MPTPRDKHRTYCKTCANFTIHTTDYVCQNCNTEYTPYFPSQVNSDLVSLQRQRYKKQRQEEIGGLYGAFIRGNGLNALMCDFETAGVIECDAGQKEIDNNRKEQREEARKKGREILNDYNTNYKHLNRNDKCTCGSDKKFKQCHLIYFRQYLNL